MKISDANKIYNIVVLLLIGFILVFASNIIVRATQTGGGMTPRDEILAKDSMANVGIGGEPEYKLHVFGEIKADAIHVDEVYSGDNNLQGLTEDVDITLIGRGDCTISINNGIITGISC